MSDKEVKDVVFEATEITETAENNTTPAVPEDARTIADINNRFHRMGRIWNSIGILLMLCVPIAIGIYYKAMPDWTVFANGGVITLIIINLGSAISEPVIYAPMLGINGEYLAFITGNLSNLKIPCVVKAHDIMQTKIGTEENELVSTIAVAVSSLVTVVVIAVLVLAIIITERSTTSLSALIAQNPFLTPSFGCVVYALFGSLGGKYMVKNPKMAIIPGLILVVLSIVLALAGSSLGSLSLMVGIALCLVFAILSFMREKKKAREKEEIRRLEAIAAGMSYEHVCEIEYYQRKQEQERIEAVKANKKANKK